ncbi:MAG: alternative ribosome rescue aminoacyl-tRNA hydrolase ArfB [Ilumatobacteraceae bacterium]|nr:MAG: aminoacyl-tRNA hydrolase [Actinomycetota bacterium]
MTDAPEPASLRVSRRLAIPLDELDIRATTSGGPGGQHANRSHTAIVVRFDVAASPCLDEAQRERLLERLGPVVTARSSTERSQARNRELALERLADKLRRALLVTPPRRATRPTRASVTRRLDAKRRHSTRKADRRPPSAAD